MSNKHRVGNFGHVHDDMKIRLCGEPALIGREMGLGWALWMVYTWLTTLF
jgi:hypothetical protein